MATLRGEHLVSLATSWRLDVRDPELPRDAPLVYALHGMGMDEDFFAVLLGKLTDLPVRLLIPRGPYPVQVPGEGKVGASWYAYDGDQERFRAELLRTERLLLDLLSAVEHEQDLRPKARILLGFSQGGYCGAFAALRNPNIFRGMIISGARVKTEFLEEEMPRAAATGFCTLLCHGERDLSVAPGAAERGRDALKAAGIAVELARFDAGHSIGRVQVAKMKQWLVEVLGIPGTT